MASNETKWRIGSVALFLLPIILVKLSGVVMSPAESAAATELTPTNSAAIAPPVQTDEQVSADVQAARAHAEALQTMPFGPMPLSTGVETGETASQPTAVAPQFNVQAILASSSGNTALIDGKPYRAGKPLGATGWTVIEIHADDRAVTIRQDTTGRTERRVVRLPGE